MLGKGLTVGITAFWLTMMALLVQREILPIYCAQREAARTPNYRRLESLAVKERVDQMGIFLGDKRIGQTVSRLWKRGEEVHMSDRAEIALDQAGPLARLLGAGGFHLSLKFEATIVEEDLVQFRLEAFSPGQPEPLAIMEGRSVGDELKMKVRHGGRVDNLTTPFPAKRVLSNLLAPPPMPAKLQVGETWRISMLNGFTYDVETAAAKVLARERIRVEGREQDAYVIRVRHGAVEMTVWANAKGEVLREKLYGITLERETPSPSVEAAPAP